MIAERDDVGIVPFSPSVKTCGFATSLVRGRLFCGEGGSFCVGEAFLSITKNRKGLNIFLRYDILKG